MVAEYDIFRAIFYYTAIILALPISTFFTTKVILFDGILGIDHVMGSVYAAVCAVVTLHIALGIFIYKAYSTDEPRGKPAKLD